MNNKVGIERCAGYEQETVYKSLKKAASEAGLPDLKGKTVLLKPNILSDSTPEKAIVTHPVFVAAAIRLAWEWGAGKVLVGDSPGVQGPGFKARLSGIKEAAEKNGAQWRDFTAEKTEITCPDGRAMKRFSVTAAVREADCVISLPKLKTHQLMVFTGAMKNLFGLLPSLTKSPLHVRFPSQSGFASMIVDLNLAVKPVYALMDGITAMEGPGPGSGRPRNVGLVLASSNLLALDAAACTVIGYPPEKIPINREALDRGFWLKSFDHIEYPGLKAEDLRIPDFEKVPLQKIDNQLLEFLLPRPLRRLLASRSPGPVIDQTLCVRCGKCVQICGAGAARLEPGPQGLKQAKIDYKRCIRSYCCHEICPAKAITVGSKRPSLF
jgi:uncharacterized protein (DUF362 family)/Pyruvate/2-oxoacid:ferredoxin oxidoreductase delta subunit